MQQYDGRGLRTSSTVGQKKTNFVYDTVSSGVPRLLVAGDLRFVYGPNGRPLEQIDAAGKPVYLHGDQINSTRLVTDAAGKAVQAFSYSAFGTVTAKSGGTVPVTPLLWAGGYRDAESGLYYLYARYYDPATAQFLSADPLTALSQTAYAYAFASPLGLVDPLGLFGLKLKDALGLISTVTAVGALVATSTVVGLPLAAVFGAVSFTTGVAAAALTCQDKRDIECGFAVGGTLLGPAGDALGIAASAGKIAIATAKDTKQALDIFGIALSIPFDAKAIAESLTPNQSSTVSVQGGTVPVSPLYDASGLCLS